MKVHFVETDFYVTMFIDGVKVEEGHSLEPEDVAALILGNENVTHEYIDGEYDEYVEAVEKAGRRKR